MGILAKKNTGGEKRHERELVILNRYGLHARPAAMFVKTSNRFKAEVWVEKDGEEVNGKSIMGLMMLAAGHGSKLKVSAAGSDAEKFLDEIEQLVASRFNEE
jgi:phosphocarrier protein